MPTYTDTFTAEYTRAADKTVFKGKVYKRDDDPKNLFCELCQIDSQGNPQPVVRQISEGQNKASEATLRDFLKSHAKSLGAEVTKETPTKRIPNPECEIIDI